jgi:phage shock protein PspC (stress-responsive transcriptional regulator)
MNKTVNINLGGILFHIDEDAYQKLNRYFEAIKRSLTNSSGQDEIIKDIEIRVSELLTEKQKTEKHVVGMKDVDEVIAVMGQPEDYRIDDEGASNTTSASFATTSGKSKKLYRDRDGAIVGGVLSGLGYYFGIDKTWLRILLIALVWAAGTGVLLYIILWIAMPEAITTSEKLEMKGEPVNLENIEKKVREEIDYVSGKLKNSGEILKNEANNFNDKYGDKINYQARNIGSSFGDFIITMLGVFAKFVGGIIFLTGVGMLIALFVTLFTVGSTTFMGQAWEDYFNIFNYSQSSLFFIGLLFFFVFGIPFFFLMLLGLKIIVPTIKSIGNIAKYTLLAVWIIAIGILISLGINSAQEVAFDNKVMLKQQINIQPTDTLMISFKPNTYYSNHREYQGDFSIVEDSVSKKLIYSKDISFEVLPTDERLPYLQIEKRANGKSSIDAKQKAEQINYKFKVIGNKLILDDYFLTNLENKFRDQEVRLFLYLPKGTLLKADENVKEFDESDNDFFNLHHSSSSYIYKVEENKVKCLNCPDYETEEYNDGNEDFNVDIDTDQESGEESININTPNIKINKNGISITADSTSNDYENNKNNKEFKELKINKDGIIIKTK